jgi:hypothetical protein
MPVLFIALGALVLLSLCALFATLGRNGTTSQRTPNQSQAPTQAAWSAADLDNAPSATAIPTLAQATVTPLPTLNPVKAAAATQTVGAATAGNMPSGSGYFYSPETSHTVSAFYDAFTQFGGVASLGFPITEPFIEQNQGDGTWAWVQYFEKATLEYHPQLDEPNRFQLSTLGAARFTQKYPGGSSASKPVPGDGTYTFAETNHTVQGAFLSFWKDGGEVRRFGYPISESFEEVSDVDSKPYTVQYFERAVMEYHPELKADQRVQLAALGTVRHTALYPAGAPASASLPQPSPTINARATALAIANATYTALAVANEATSTAVAANALTAADQDYLSKAEEWSSDYSTAISSLSDLMSEAGTDTSLLFDDDWKSAVVVDLVLMNLTSDEILQYGTPPSKFASIHSDFRVIAREANSAVDNITSGIDNFDADAIDRGTANLKNITTYANRILGKLQALTP